jgi:hypothetical protein
MSAGLTQLNRSLALMMLIKNLGHHSLPLLKVYFGTQNMFITFWFGFVYGTNPPLGTLII